MKKDSLLAVCFAEFFGTFFFVTIGLSSVAVLVLGMSDLNYPWMAGCWGMAVTLAIYLVGGISGAHMNPAVTISLAVFGGFSKSRVIPYIASQIIGAFCSAALVYAMFGNNIMAFESANGLVRGTAEGMGSAGIFVTGAGAGVSMVAAFINEVVLTALLLIVIYSTTDSNNPSAPNSGIAAIAIGASITFGGIASGPLSGFAMNPARDLGPRLFVMINGWGSHAWGVNYYGILMPIVATILGGIIAGFLYKKVLTPCIVGEVKTPQKV